MIRRLAMIGRRRKIGFAYDLFRGPALGQWDASRQARWLQAFLTPAIEAAGGSVQDSLAAVMPNAAAWASKLVSNGLLPPGSEGWARLYGGKPLDGQERWFENMLGFDLLVGYELSANQLRFLARHGVTFLDIGIDAVRFTRRTLFRVRTNTPSIRWALRSFHVPAQVLAADIGFLRATHADGMPGPAEDLLFVGQVEVDSSLIVNGHIQRVSPHLPRLLELARQHRRFEVHLHPLANHHPDATAVLTACSRSVLGEGQIYGALMAARTRTVVTLSSSVASEAELLGKQTVRLIQPDGSSEALGKAVVCAYKRVDGQIAQASFWGAVLGMARGVSSIGYGPDDASLRSALGVFTATSTMIRPVPSVSVGVPVCLTDPVNEGLCRLGWHSAEPSGRWTEGTVAVIAFNAAAAAVGVMLSLKGFIGPVLRILRIRIVLTPAHGNALDTNVSLEDEAERDICLSADVPPGHTTLKLLIDAPYAPADFGISPDTRQLGVHLSVLQLLHVMPTSA